MKKLLLAVLLAGIATAPVLEAKSSISIVTKKSYLRSNRGYHKSGRRKSMVRTRTVTRIYSVPVITTVYSRPARSNNMSFWYTASFRI